MRQTKMTDLITLAFNRTEASLFRPFLFKKWIKWCFIACLGGGLFGGFNFLNFVPQKPYDKGKIPSAAQTAGSKPSIKISNPTGTAR